MQAFDEEGERLDRRGRRWGLSPHKREGRKEQDYPWAPPRLMPKPREANKVSPTPTELVTKPPAHARYQAAVKRHLFLYALAGITLVVFGGVLQQYFDEATVGVVLMIVGLLALFAVVIPASDGSPSFPSDSGGVTDGLPPGDDGHGHDLGSFGDFGGHGGGH